MSLGYNIVVEVRSGGSDTNGGGFNSASGGVDLSQSNTPAYAVTDGVTNGTTTLTSATAAFGTDVVGNCIYVAGGTAGLTGNWYLIASRTNATTIVVDRTIAASTGCTFRVGGAIASLGTAGAIQAQCLGYYRAFVKNGSYTITSASSNVSGGVFTATIDSIVIGYDTTRTVTNTDANRPIFAYGVGGVTPFSGLALLLVVNMRLDGNGQATAKAVNGANLHRCVFTNMSTASTSYNVFSLCSATTNSAAVFAGTTGFAYGCEAYANTATPFSGNFLTCVRCLSYNNTGASTDGFGMAASGSATHCIAYGNGRNGFINGSQYPFSYINCHAESNGAYGFDVGASFNGKVFLNCSAYSNTSGTVNTFGNLLNSGFITVTAGSVFTNAAGGDFSLNATTNQGALLRDAGSPATFPAGLTANYADIGAAQHQGGGSGGGALIGDGLIS